MGENVKKIENNTDRLIYLPPMSGVELEDEATGEIKYWDFPEGIRLTPGLNSVPKLYLDALHARKVPMYDKLGKVRTGRKGEELFRYPGRELIAQLIAPCNHTTFKGPVNGPQVTIFEDQQVGREDGPAAPASLPQNTNAAMAIIGMTEDRKALERWSKATRDQGLKIAIQTRLAGLKAA